jgi:curli production assembly/transport component CsgE
MKYTAVLSVMSLQLVLAAGALAQSSINSSATVDQHRTLNHRDVGGVVIGQTITLAGRAFFDSFAIAWSEKDETENFTVAITERPTTRLGSQVFVDYGNRRLFQTFLPPNRTLIPAIGASAAAEVYQAILDYQLAQFFGDPDVGRDEL